MDCTELYIFVEGVDDERFVNTVIQPLICHQFMGIYVIKYAHMSEKKVRNYLRTIKMHGSSCLYLRDLDLEDCVVRRRDITVKEYDALDVRDVVIVAPEIEAWYLAGVTNDTCRRLRLKWRDRTDDITKEKFDSLIPERFDGARVDFMTELLKGYSLELAAGRNASFAYLVRRLHLLDAVRESAATSDALRSSERG